MSEIDADIVLRNLEAILTLDGADIDRIRQLARDTWDVIIVQPEMQRELTEDECNALDNAYALHTGAEQAEYDRIVMDCVHDDR